MRNYLLPFLLLITFLSFSQKVKIRINDVNYSNNSICDFEPYTIDCSFSNTRTNVFKGTFKLVRGKMIIHEITLDTSMYYQDRMIEFYSMLKTNDRLVLDVEKIWLDNTVKSYSMFAVVRIGKLTPTINPKGDILINKSVMYRANGICLDSISAVEYVTDSLTELVSIRIIPVRGTRPLTSGITFTNQDEININHNVFPNTLQGDKLFIYIYNKKKVLSDESKSIPINQPFKVINVLII